jgi:cell division protein FtsN
MKKALILMITALLSISCSKKPIQQVDVDTGPVVSTERTEQPEPAPQPEPPIVEREETIVESEEESPTGHRYYVIIGSFLNRPNAVNYQAELTEKGFMPILMMNEEGYFRVSVMSTNEILDARNRIKSIRSQYPEHADTWLLIKK